MRTTLHPIGILIAHTLPALLLAMLYADALSVIHPLLNEESLAAWRLLGLSLGGVVGASTVYAALAWWKRAQVHVLYSALAFLAYVPMLWMIGEHMRLLFPWDIPRWMVPSEPELYAFRLVSIPLAHALFVLVARSLPEGDRGKPVRDLLIAAAIPLAVYLFVQVVEPFRGGADFERHAWLVVMVCLTIGFLFLLFRGVTAMVLRVGNRTALAHAARILVALVLPLWGLALNNGIFGGVMREAVGLFGDLSHPAFYIICLLNAAVVIWPSSPVPLVRFGQFIVRAACFPYVIYFFVLFVPLLPLSVLAIIAVGMGFLLLAPVLLFVLQSMLLWQDARFLLAHRSWKELALASCLAMALLPAGIILRNLEHRNTLHGALRYVYESDPDEPIRPLHGERLAHVLEQVDANRSRNRWRGNGSGGNTPFLTPLYNRIVLDHLTLSDEKADILSQVVLGLPAEQSDRWRMRMPSSTHTVLDSAWSESRYDAEQQAWRSWVHLSIRNTAQSQEEYVTEVELPDGAWISDHYLMIEGDTAKGILAEEKAALWVYNSIVTYRRDPSILRYIGHNRVQLRVFPFEAEQVRTTGFELLHREALPIRFGERELQLGDPSRDPPAESIGSGEPGVVFMPASLKQRLDTLRRTPHVHLIVDASEAQRERRADAAERVRRFAAEHVLDARNATLHITDGYGSSRPYSDEALDAFAQHAGHGGFFTDRAIRRVIAHDLVQPGPEAPFIVIVPSMPAYDERARGIWLDDLPDLAALMPEGDRFFVLYDTGMLEERRFSEPERGVNAEPVRIEHPIVRAWPDAANPSAYLPDTPQGSVSVDYAHLGNHSPPRERWWTDALALEGRQRALALRAVHSSVSWRSVVRGSFQAQVLTPQTAWMCLEDEAQRNALLKKQEEVLNSNESLDVSDQEITNMSEPAMWWLLPALLLVLWWRRR